MKSRVIGFSIGGAFSAALLFAATATTASALAVSCSGVPGVANITWAATSTGGVAPVAFLWGNGATSSLQTIAATAGTSSMSLQGTDASSTVATTSCLAVVTANATSTAGTGSSLQDQIQALLQRIASLQKQVAQLIFNAATGGGTSTTTPGSIGSMPPGQIGKLLCVTLNRDLGIGSHGSDVESLQEMLAQDPDDGFVGTTTGFFGKQTARALAHFQLRFGIASSTDGFVGSITRGFLHRHCGKGLGHERELPDVGNRSMNNERHFEREGDVTSTSTMHMDRGNFRRDNPQRHKTHESERDN